MPNPWTALDWNVWQDWWLAYWPYVVAAAAVSCLVVIDRFAMRWRVGRVAARLGARVTRARGDALPTLEWRDGGRLARLAFPRSEGGRSLRATVCRVAWAQPVRFAVDVRRRGLLAQAGLWLPARRGEVRTGQTPFDRCFVIRSSDPATAARWLDREVRRTLVRLARCPGGAAFRLACDGDALVARLGGAVTGSVELRLFAESTVWLGRTIEAAAWDSAVQFAPVASATSISGRTRSRTRSRTGESSVNGPLCPACAEPTGRHTESTCPVCRAPHHVACWEWLGGCGVFGCAGADAAVRAA